MNGVDTAALRSVVIIGTGLIGTSVALALQRKDIQVYLRDSNPAAAAAAAQRGAGIIGRPPAPADVAVLAVPPSRIAEVLAASQAEGMAHVYTDVAGAKSALLAQAGAFGCDLGRFVGGHPMAGSESSGPSAASGSLFHGKTWVLTPTADTDERTLSLVRQLVRATGARPVLMTAGQHDRAVARASHVPHVVASALAASLARADDSVLAVCGTGIRDATRIAAGDPVLWDDILRANAAEVSAVLGEIAADLISVAHALLTGSPELTSLLERGNVGRMKILSASP